MKVVMLTNATAPEKLGGLERYVAELSAALVEIGDDVVVVAKATGDAVAGVERLPSGPTVVRYRVPSKRNPLFAVAYPLVVAAAVRRALRAVGADRSAVRRREVLLHGHFPVPMISVLLARLPFVYTMHAPVNQELLGERQGSYRLPAPARRPAVAALALLERQVLRRAEHVVTLSTFIAQEAERLAGDGLPLWKISGGIDIDHFAPGTGPAHEGSPVLFAARRLVERTGVELLIEAMPAVLARYPEARLSIAGDGPRRPHIERRIDELGLRSAVRLLGRISDADLLSWYRSADLCITPTLYLEGFGLSTAEALACGTPVVVTPAGANAELVRPLHPVLVAAEVTPRALADAVIASWARFRDDYAPSQVRAAVAPAMGWSAIAEEHHRLYSDLKTRESTAHRTGASAWAARSGSAG